MMNGKFLYIPSAGGKGGEKVAVKGDNKIMGYEKCAEIKTKKNKTMGGKK